VRVITATNQNLEAAVEDKKFREDLFYRINVIPIHIPPLRERKLDIPILANHFLAKFNQINNKAVKTITPEAMHLFMRYSWPGNVRELQNLMERIVVIKETGEVCVDDIPGKMHTVSEKQAMQGAEISLPEEGVDFNEVVSNFEKELLLKALKKTGGVKNSAARLLKLNRTTLVEKLRRFNILTPS